MLSVDNCDKESFALASPYRDSFTMAPSNLIVRDVLDVTQSLITNAADDPELPNRKTILPLAIIVFVFTILVVTVGVVFAIGRYEAT